MSEGPRIDELARAPRLLAALDFDGTVAPLQDDPSRSRITPAAQVAIDRLRALPDTWVAFVSGRGLESLAQLTQAGPDALLVGSHGVEVSIRGQIADLELTADERERLGRLEAELAQLVASVPYARLEHKPVGYAVHTRVVEQQDLIAPLQQAAQAAADDIGGFTTRVGKDIVEFSVRDVNKGDGVRMLRALLAEQSGVAGLDTPPTAAARPAAARPADDSAAVAVLYAGDDVTDEDAFAVLEPGDLGVKIGEGATRAAARVADVPAFEELLAELAARREASVRPQ